MKDELEVLHDRYARALFICAQDDKNTDKVMDELTSLNTEWLEDKEFSKFLTYPIITPYEKKKMVERLSKVKKFSNTILNFLNILINNHRENLLHGIFLRFRDLYDESKNKTRISLETAYPIEGNEKNTLLKTLKAKFHEGIDVDIKEHPALISGIIIRHNGRMYDYSIRGELKRLKQALVN